MKQKHWCGMTARVGSVLSGVFTILATSLSLIFEDKYLRSSNCTEMSRSARSVTALIRQNITCWSLHIVLFLSGIVISSSCLLLYSVYAQKCWGLVTHVVWVLFFELVSAVVQTLTNSNTAITEVRIMRWFGFVSRVVLHCFWMFFVITYARTIHQKPGKVHPRQQVHIYRQRRIPMVEIKDSQLKMNQRYNE